MSLSIGIVGLPNAGKSTLFNALTNAGVVAASYPFATIAPNTGVVPIPDPRLRGLAGIFNPGKVTPATVTFVDIAGLVRGASEGEGLGNRFLANIRDVDAVLHVVRAFEDPRVAHIDDGVDPKRDIEIVEVELALADLETVERRLARLERESKADREPPSVIGVLRELRDVVASGRMISGRLVDRGAEYADLHLLTAKPVIYLFNCDEATLGDGRGRLELASLVEGSEALFIDAQIESELAQLTNDDRAELLAATGRTEPGLDAVVRAAYRALGLQSFLTGNPKEVRAWTIRSGANALEAAGVIHTDFQRGFIAAEVVDFDDLIEAGSWSAARAAGQVRTEGRSYVMRPNDVVDFRFNV